VVFCCSNYSHRRVAIRQSDFARGETQTLVTVYSIWRGGVKSSGRGKTSSVLERSNNPDILYVGANAYIG
jgi:hypothetical protein